MNSQKLTNILLGCGIAAGPLYLLLGLVQILVRPGFDVTRHALSLMSNGDLGWIQIANFLVTGLLLIAFAAGIRRALAGQAGGMWGPILFAIYGIGLIGAGIFKADPALGFPPGTPTDAQAISTTGLLHFVFGGIGFYAVIAACFVFARRFRVLGQCGWSWFSIITGIIFLIGFIGIALGSGGTDTIRAIVTVSFYLAVLLIWFWITAVAAKTRSMFA